MKFGLYQLAKIAQACETAIINPTLTSHTEPHILVFRKMLAMFYNIVL